MYLQKNNFYIVENSVLFDLTTYRIFYITENISNYLINDEKNKHSITQDVYSIMNKNEQDILGRILEHTEHTQEYSLNTSPYLTSIKLHISNTCNLRCKYCYAQGGNYGTKDALMGFDTIDKILKFINESEEFKKLENISFFGGEPFMAPDAINYICEKTKHKNLRYMLQTNGTILNEKIISLIKKYNILLTISIDGPKEVNDYNRIDTLGHGSFERIMNNIKILKENGIELKAVQATLSSEFLDRYSKEDIADFIYKNVGVHFVKVENDMTIKETLSERFLQKEINVFFNKLLSGEYIFDSCAYKILKVFFTKHYNDFICPAGTDTISFDVNGNIYPCQLFLEDTLWLMGDVENSYTSNLTQLFQKSRKNTCKDCFARGTCSICIVQGIKENLCIRNRTNLKLVLESLAKYITLGRFEELFTKFSLLSE